MQALVVIAESKNPLRYGRGDVICVVSDDHQWSRRELENKAWRIVKLSDDEALKLSLVAEEFKVTEEVSTDPKTGKSVTTQRSVLLQKRAVKLDLDTLGVTKDDAATRTDSKTFLTKQQVTSLVVVKPSLDDSVDVLG